LTILYNKALALEECRKLEEAKEIYEEIIKKYPGYDNGEWVGAFRKFLGR
jgi:hypothetical protein